VRVTFDLDLPDGLHGELIRASQERSCSLKQFCTEAVEVLLAGRRQQRLRPEDAYARKGPRQYVADADDETEIQP
jgi:hypothetical protein